MRKLKSENRYDYLLSRYFTDWLDLPVAEITKSMIVERHKVLSARGGTQADLVFRTLRSVLNFALAFDDPKGNGILVANPVQVLSSLRAWNKKGPRKKCGITAQNIPAIYKSTLGLKNVGDRDFLLLLLFTGMRRGEALKLRWSDVDLQNKVIHLTATKNGDDCEKYISSHLLQVFDARREREPVTECIFPGRAWTTKSTHIHHSIDAHDKVVAETGVKFACHDYRRFYATIGNSIGISPFTLKALLGHRVADVTSLYVNLSPEDLTAASQKICDKIMTLVSREVTG